MKILGISLRNLLHLKKLIVAQLVKEFPVLYELQVSIHPLHPNPILATFLTLGTPQIIVDRWLHTTEFDVTKRDYEAMYGHKYEDDCLVGCSAL